MREILFRGKLKAPRKGWGGVGSLVNTYDWYTREQHCFIADDDYEDRDEWEVDPETVGQYTGLEDKNGVKIFDGDILKDKWGENGFLEYSDKHGCFLVIPCEPELKKCYRDGEICSSDLSDFNMLITMGEIIGNIHDSPELLA